MQPRCTVSCHATRPSLFDERLRGDPWISVETDETLSLCFDSRQIASVAGLTLDQHSLNRLLFQVRHRFPRRNG
jgi:hypothetical protein